MLALLAAPPRCAGQDAEPASTESAATEAQESATDASAAPSSAEQQTENAAPTVYVEPPQEVTPYVVLVSLSFQGDASIGARLRESVTASVPTLLRSRLGQMWTLTVRDDRQVSPPTRSVLERLDTDDLNARFVPGEFDKVILLTVSRQGSAYEVAGREWDRNSRTAGPAVVRETCDRRRVNEVVAGVASEVFRPIAMIHEVGEEVIELGIRAGEFLAPDEDQLQFQTGDYLIVYFRYLDRQRDVRQIQFVPWTFLQVDSVERARMLCHVVSTFRRNPLGGSRRRVELMGIAARPLLDATELTLVPRVDPLNPLVGHRVDVMDRLPTVDDPVEDRVTLLTDRGGTVVVPADPAKPLRHALVHSGGEVLASVPFIPGLERRASLELPDDTPRLDVEGELQMMQDELIDVVASRSVIMARARQAARAGKWDEVDRFRDELDALTTFEDMDRRLNNIRVTADQTARRLGDRIAQSRIARLCREFREVAESRLAANIIQDFHTEMDQLRTAGG